MPKKPEMALRREDNGDLDDIVLTDVKMFRAEHMGDGIWWVACYLDDEASEQLVLWFHTKKPPVAGEVPSNVRDFDRKSPNAHPAKDGQGA